MYNMINFLCFTSSKPTKIGRILDVFAQLLDEFLVPFLIGIGVIGGCYGLWLGINFARQEGDAKGEARKRLVNFLIGFVSVIVLLVLLRIYTNNAEALIEWIEKTIYDIKPGSSAGAPTPVDPPA